MQNPSFMFLAGDPSGDQNSAPIIRRLRREIPGCVCCGIGGPRMQAEGFVPLVPFEGFNRMGYWEVLKNIGFFIRAKKKICEELRVNPPQVLICVDFSGFNTPLMKEAHGRGIPVLWYIAPKAWAWKKKKHITNLQKYAAHVAVIFPFEAAFFGPYLDNLSFVGNPLVERLDSDFSALGRPDIPDLQTKETIRLALVPGSRRHEIENTLAVMLRAVSLLKRSFPSLQATVSTCGHIPREAYTRLIGNDTADLFEGPLEELLASCDLAVVTSGTATLQTALMGVPMVIVYKISWITYRIYKTFIRGLHHVGLPNIIAAEEVAPELLQNEMTPHTIAAALGEYLESPQRYRAAAEKLRSLKERLGGKKPSVEVPRLIMALAGRKGPA